MKKIIIVLILLVVVILAAFVFVSGKIHTPQLVTPEGMHLSEDISDAIISAKKGFYNKNIPIFAQRIEILEHDATGILYRVYYFPFGSIDRSYSQEPDGEWIFNLERPLSGIN